MATEQTTKSNFSVESTEQSAKRQKQYFTVRSSALFYVSSKGGMDTEISFLNHFLLKRGISKVVCFASFRTLAGELVKRFPLTVTDPKVYTFRASEICGRDFEGSADIEFYSVENIFVPYSAVSVIYSCPNSFCQMHSYTRTYNPHELEESHVILTGEEAGWTLRDHEAGVESIAYFHNGPEQYSTGFDIEIVNDRGDRRLIQIPSREIRPFETVALIPSRYLDVKHFLNGHEGQAAISFKTTKVFPRMLCGNRKRTQEGESQSERIHEFQATHSNFNYSRIDTPRLKPGESGFTFIPKLEPCEDVELLVYPHHLGTDKLEATSRSVAEPISQKRGSVLDVAPGDEVVFSTTDPRGLPNRVVNTVICHYSTGRLPAECSGGILTSGYIAENKHWYWGIGTVEGCLASLSCTLGTRFLSLENFNKEAEIRLYDSEGECGSTTVDLEAAMRTPINLNAILSRLPKGTVWYRCTTDYPLVLLYCSIYDPRKKSGSFEHSF